MSTSNTDNTSEQKRVCPATAMDADDIILHDSKFRKRIEALV
jgi:hypothetical protein